MGPRLISRGGDECTDEREHAVGASMGPRLISRGGGWRTRLPVAATGFNGAAAEQLRRLQPRLLHLLVWEASMGPRLNSRGGAGYLVRAALFVELQWGRS